MARYSNEAFFKVQRRIFDSSIWMEDAPTRIVWLTLMHLAQLPDNRKHGHGMVVIPRVFLMKKANVSAEEFEHAIERLTSEDPYSRSDQNGGRRIEVLPNGFRLLGFEDYHDSDRYQENQKAQSERGKRRAAAAKIRPGGRFAPKDFEVFIDVVSAASNGKVALDPENPGTLKAWKAALKAGFSSDQILFSVLANLNSEYLKERRDFPVSRLLSTGKPKAWLADGLDLVEKKVWGPAADKLEEHGLLDAAREAGFRVGRVEGGSIKWESAR